MKKQANPTSKSSKSKKVRKVPSKAKDARIKLAIAGGVLCIITIFIVVRKKNEAKKVVMQKYQQIPQVTQATSKMREKLAEKYAQSMTEGMSEEDVTKIIAQKFTESPEWKKGQDKLAKLGLKLNPPVKVADNTYRISTARLNPVQKFYEKKEMDIHSDRAHYKESLKSLNNGKLPKVTAREALYIQRWRESVKKRFKSFK